MAQTKLLKRKTMNLDKMHASQSNAGEGKHSPKSQKSVENFNQKLSESAAGDANRENTNELEERVLAHLEDQAKKNGDDEHNKTIEEESFVEEDLSGDDVKNFLKELGPDTGLPLQNLPNMLDESAARAKKMNATSRLFEPVMAFNDVRISGARAQDMKLMTFDRGMMPKKGPTRNNLMTLQGNKDRVVKGQEQDLQGGGTALDKILQDLDYDKIVADQNGYIDHEDQDRQNKTQNDFTDRDLPAAHDPHGKDVDDLFAVDHPLDLSFTKDKNYGNRAGAGGYASDNDKQRALTKQSIDELSGSISISDGSIVAKMQQTKKPDDDYSLQGSAAKKNGITARGLKRMLTSDMKGDRSKMNDSQSTFLGINPSFR